MNEDEKFQAFENFWLLVLQLIAGYVKWMVITPLIVFYIAGVFLTAAILLTSFQGAEMNYLLVWFLSLFQHGDFAETSVKIYLVAALFGEVVELLLHKYTKFKLDFRKWLLMFWGSTFLVYAVAAIPFVFKIAPVANNDYSGMLFVLGVFFAVTQVVFAAMFFISYAGKFFKVDKSIFKQIIRD